jgi:hypothetical protein
VLSSEYERVVEVNTPHAIRGKMETRFDLELRDRKLAHLQSHAPYRPHGLAEL